MNRGEDTGIGTAAANIAVHGCIDISVSRFFIGSEQGGGRHDLAGLAVTALHYIYLAPCGLHGLAYFVILNIFYGGDFFTNSGRNWCDARAYRLPIKMNRTSATLRHATAKFSSC